MTADALDLIRSANRRVCELLEHPAWETGGATGQFPSVTEFRSLTQLLQQVAPAMAAESNDAELRAEISAYRENLKRLRDRLAKMQSELTAQQDNLRAEWKKLQAAAAWASSWKQTR